MRFQALICALEKKQPQQIIRPYQKKKKKTALLICTEGNNSLRFSMHALLILFSENMADTPGHTRLAFDIIIIPSTVLKTEYWHTARQKLINTQHSNPQCVMERKQSHTSALKSPKNANKLLCTLEKGAYVWVYCNLVPVLIKRTSQS